MLFRSLSEYEMAGLEFYPQLGEHNREVLGGLLGMSDTDIAALEAEGVISRAEQPRTEKTSS